MHRFDGVPLRSSLEKLPKWKRIGFVVMVCERMMPNFRRFGSETGFDVSSYDDLVNLAWGSLNKPRNGMNYINLSEKSFAGAPSTDEFVHRFTSLALNAALSVTSLMSILDDGRVEHGIEVAKLACDGVELYVQFLESVPPRPVPRAQVLEHALMQRELERQKNDLEFLQSMEGAIPYCLCGNALDVLLR